MKTFLNIFGWACILVSMVLYGLELRVKNAQPVVIHTPPAEYALPTETAVVPTAVAPTITTVEETAPTAVAEEALVERYILKDPNGGGEVDLGSGKPVAFSVFLPEGGQLSGTWADAYAQIPGEEDLFENPHNGTVLAMGGTPGMEGEILTLFVHSGAINYNPTILFGSYLDLYLRVDGERKLTLDEGQQKLGSLMGAKAIFCQEEGREPFLYYSGTCNGNIVNMKISAAAIVTADKIDLDDPESYSYAAMSIKTWMKRNYPGKGFEDLDQDSMVLITCVQRYPSQFPLNGVEDSSYNRLVLGLTVDREPLK